MTLDVLLIGFSKFSRRRVIPVVANMEAVGAIHMASRRGQQDALVCVPKCECVYRDYQVAIDECPGALVYVSLTNEQHAVWVERALERGHHVVVDKPAFLDLATAERLVSLARRHSVVLAEASIFSFHPVVTHIANLFRDHQTNATHVIASFTPPVPSDNYRYRSASGGGALLDLGPYFASVGRVIWGEEPQRISAVIGSRSADGEVETSFSVLASYAGGRALVGHFGFTTEYTNRIQLLGSGLSVEVSRVFSTPPEMVSEVVVRHRNDASTQTVPAADSMRIFLDRVLDCIAAKDYVTLSESLLSDARVRDALARAVTLD